MRQGPATIRTFVGTGLLALQLLWAVSSYAAAFPEIGENVTGQVELLGKQVPLPSGEWRVASAGYGHVADEAPGPYGAIGAVLLLQVTEQPDRAFLLIQTNALPVREGWGRPSECSAPDVLFQDVAESRNLHDACSFIIATRPSRLARAALPALGPASPVLDMLPPWALVLGFRASDRRDVLDIRYGIVPRTLRPDGWFLPSDTLDPAHRAVLERLGAWTLNAREVALAALREPAEQVPSLPPLPFGDAANVAIPPQQITALRLALYKLGTYRIASTVTSLTIGTILTGSLYGGAVLAFWQALTHSAVFFANEMLWEWPHSVPTMPFIATPPNVPAGALPAAAAITPRTLLAANGAILPLPADPHNPTPLAPDPSHMRDVFAIDGKFVPLPEGNWTLLAQDSDDRATGTVLARLSGGSVLGLVVIHSNPKPMTAIFGTSSECGRSDIAFAVTRYDTPEDGYCTYAKRIAVDIKAGDTSLWGKAAARLTASGMALPPAFMMVGARARTRENFLDVRYYFLPDPALTHRDPQDTGLTPDPIAAMQAWADLAQEPIELGVRGRLPATNIALPWPWQANVVKDALVWQARGPLEDLAAIGVLDDSALLHQLALADHALVDRERQRWSVWERSAYKVATYRAASFVDTTAVTALVTGSVGLGVGNASFTAVFKPMVAYANEILWAQAGIGKAPASLLPANFPDIGHDLP
jgi:uncharacterized membrane protein